MISFLVRVFVSRCVLKSRLFRLLKLNSFMILCFKRSMILHGGFFVVPP